MPCCSPRAPITRRRRLDDLVAAENLPMQPEHLVHLFTTVHGPDLQRLFSAYAEHVRLLSPRYKAIICRALHRTARQRGDGAEATLSSPGSGAVPLHAAMHEVSAIANILLCTGGCELTELKNRLDSAETAHDLVNLCALLPPGLREHVLSHIQREASVALLEWNGERWDAAAAQPGGGGSGMAGGSGSSSSDFWWPTKVYCDFDDTVQVRGERDRALRVPLLRMPLLPPIHCSSPPIDTCRPASGTTATLGGRSTRGCRHCCARCGGRRRPQMPLPQPLPSALRPLGRLRLLLQWGAGRQTVTAVAQLQGLPRCCGLARRETCSGGRPLTWTWRKGKQGRRTLPHCITSRHPGLLLLWRRRVGGEAGRRRP